jgi:hypothetical protein
MARLKAMPSRQSPKPRAKAPTVDQLVRRDCRAAFLLRFREGRRYVRERRNVLIDIGFGVLDLDRPLLIPPLGLGHDAAIHHPKPVMPP